MELSPIYISKINSDCENQIIFLIIPNEEKEASYYLAVKNCIIERNLDY